MHTMDHMDQSGVDLACGFLMSLRPCVSGLALAAAARLEMPNSQRVHVAI